MKYSKFLSHLVDVVKYLYIKGAHILRYHTRIFCSVFNNCAYAWNRHNNYVFSARCWL